MPESTSIEAFREAKESGLINQRQLQIMEYMNDVGAHINPVSQRDVQRKFFDLSSSFHPRFCELERLGAIVHVGVKKDPATNRTVKVYKIGKAPTEKLPKQLTARAILRELLTDFNLGQYVYDIRDREGQGWSGPRTYRFSQLIEAAEKLME